MSYFQTTPWQDAAAVGSGIGNTLAAMLIQGPELRARRQERLAEQQYRERSLAQQEKHGALYDAEALFTGEKRKGLEQSRMAAQMAGKSLSAAGMAKTPEEQKAHLSDFLLYGGQMSHADRNGLIETLAQTLQMGNPNMQRMIALGTKSPYDTVGPNATMLDLGGSTPQIVATGPRTLSEGELALGATLGNGPQEVVGRGLPKTFPPANTTLPPSVIAPFARNAAGQPGNPGSGDTNALNSLSAFVKGLEALQIGGVQKLNPTAPQGASLATTNTNSIPRFSRAQMLNMVAPEGKIKVVQKATGAVGFIPVEEFDSAKYERF